MAMTGFELILPFLRPIQHLILDPEISEIMVNGPEHVFIERRGYIEQVQHIALSLKSLEVAVKNIARRLGDDISEEKPILDSGGPSGSRLAAVLPHPGATWWRPRCSCHPTMQLERRRSYDP
jgi:pilus assembly protein CpaF